MIKEDHLINLMAVSEIRQIKDGWFVWYILWLLPDRGETFNPAITTAYVSLLTGGTLNPVLTKSTKNYVSWIFTGSYSYKDKFVLNEIYVWMVLISLVPISIVFTYLVCFWKIHVE